MDYQDDPAISMDIEKAPEGELPSPEVPTTAHPKTEAMVPEAAAPHLAAKLEAPALKANLSAIASADVVDLETTASALALTQVSGDAHISSSWAGIVWAKQGGTFQQGYASTAIFGGDTTIKQAGSPLIVGRSMNIEQGGGAVLIGSDVKVSHGFVGVLISGRSEVSDDSKVLVGTKAATIIAAALLGGLALVAAVMAIGPKRIETWGRNIKMPDMPSRRDVRRWGRGAQSVFAEMPARVQQLLKNT